jgi:hypothetical protein
MNRLGETRGWEDSFTRSADTQRHRKAALADTSKELQTYMKAHAEFMEIGSRMLRQWEEGVALSLKAA